MRLDDSPTTAMVRAVRNSSITCSSDGREPACGTRDLPGCCDAFVMVGRRVLLLYFCRSSSQPVASLPIACLSISCQQHLSAESLHHHFGRRFVCEPGPLRESCPVCEPCPSCVPCFR